MSLTRLIPVIAVFMFMPVCAQAAVIQYQEVALRYLSTTQVRDATTFESDLNGSAIGIIPNPPDTLDMSTLGDGSATLGFSFDLDQDNNAFLIDVVIATTNAPADNIFASASGQVRLFIDFTVESDQSDIVELMFSVDSLSSGNIDEALPVFPLARLALGSTRVGADGRVVGPVLAGTSPLPVNETLFLNTGQQYSIVATVDIDNRVNTGNDGLIDVDGSLQFLTQLSVREVPEPPLPLMGAIGLAFLFLTRRRARSLTARSRTELVSS